MKNLVSLVLVFSTMLVYSQDTGTLSGGFQSESQFYENDKLINANAPDEKMASNNYLKLDYSINNFSFGIRYEAYLPPLLGYPVEYEGTGIANRYATFTNDILRVTAGNYYEQFGSGMVLRAYEERLLGIDNSLDGVKVELFPRNGISLTGVYGQTRKFFETGLGTVRGLDGNFSINELIALEGWPAIKLGGSSVSKFEEYTGPDEYPEIVNAYSARASVTSQKMNFDIEYVEKGIDPTASNNYNVLRKGRGLLVNSGFFKKGLGISATFRRLENMDYRSERDASLTNLWMNYLPAETRQHGYLLPNIYPYAVQSQGEIGGQLNVNYTIPKGSGLGGKYGTKIALNYSQFNKLKNRANPALSLEEFNTKFFEVNDSLLYRDFNVEVKKKVSRFFSTTLSFISMEYNKFEIEGIPSDNVKSNIGVIETLFKFSRRRSIRSEVQHLWTKEDKQNWAAGLIEFTVAPKWSFFGMDQYNYGSDKKPHYYQFGFSYVQTTTRIAMRYGRQRGGLLCVGGVCRNVPSASGLNLSISTTF